jgi:hypothetical protein
MKTLFKALRGKDLRITQRAKDAKGLQYIIPSHHFTTSFLCGFAPFALCVSSSFQMSPDHQNVDMPGADACGF